MRRIILLICLVYLPTVFAMTKPIDTSKAINFAIKRYGLHKEPHLMTYFSKAGVRYPPQKIALLAFKQEKYIQLWAKDSEKDWQLIHTYPLTASSGTLGPKLREHDKQIPEGLYHLTMLNPFSEMHLSMMIDYPNAFDRLHALKDGRNKLGGNIFLHGKALSVGCLAVGDDAIDELFLLAHRVGLQNVQLIIAPNDFRTNKPPTVQHFQPHWLPELYHKIDKALSHFPLRKKTNT